MTLTYRPTQEQDPQEPGSQHNPGAGPRDGMDQQTAPPASPPRIAEPIRRRVVVRPPVTPPSGDRFFSQEDNGQNLSANNQKQAIEQLPTGALPAPGNRRLSRRAHLRRPEPCIQGTAQTGETRGMEEITATALL